MLLTEKRLGYLQDVQRTPRQYMKRSDEYWSQEILERHNKRPRLSNESCDNEDELSSLTADELRLRLKDMGVKTKVRNVNRLLDMYRIALQSNS